MRISLFCNKCFKTEKTEKILSCNRLVETEKMLFSNFDCWCCGMLLHSGDIGNADLMVMLIIVMMMMMKGSVMMVMVVLMLIVMSRLCKRASWDAIASCQLLPGPAFHSMPSGRFGPVLRPVLSSATRALGSLAGPRLIRTPGSPKESQDEGFSLPGLCPKLWLQPAADKSPNQVFALQSSSHSGNSGTILEVETEAKAKS